MKWLHVLRGAQRHIRQLANEWLEERAIFNRVRSIQLLSHHIFRFIPRFASMSLRNKTGKQKHLGQTATTQLAWSIHQCH